MMSKIVFISGAALWLCAVFAMGQQAQPSNTATASARTDQVISDQDIAMLRKDIRSQKKQIIASNMPLTDAEAQKFWPIYDSYTADLVKINDTKYDLIKQYAQSYASMTDAQASAMAAKWLQVDEDVSALRKKYFPQVLNAVGGKKAALYEQLDRRTQMMIDVQLASQLPLVDAGQ